MGSLANVVVGTTIDPTTFGNAVVDLVNKIGAGCSLYRSTPLSVGASANTTLAMNAEDHDTASFHDNSTNPSRITIPAGYGGLYFVSYCIDPAAVTAGVSCWIQKNGNSTVRYAGAATTTSASAVFPLVASCVMDLAAGDYVEVGAFHSAVGAQNWLNNSNNRARFTASLIGPS